MKVRIRECRKIARGSLLANKTPRVMIQFDTEMFRLLQGQQKLLGLSFSGTVRHFLRMSLGV